jgi:tRNA pseudouridine38-40 synthase
VQERGPSPFLRLSWRAVPTVRLLLEYDGAGFAGWAKQRGERTVEGVVEEGAAKILHAPVDLTVAGRTDRGVHAWGQVASFEASRVPLLRSLNAVLPRDVAVLSAEEAADGFDARKDAESRTYCYRVLARRQRSAIERGRALWWPHPVDREALGACAAALRGTHDFTAFTPSETYHVRFERDVFDARWEDASGDLLEFWIEADTFMRHMNRVLVGTMLEVAGGRRTLDDFVRLLEGAHRREAGETAPAHGLALVSVRYGSERTGPVEPAAAERASESE